MTGLSQPCFEVGNIDRDGVTEVPHGVEQIAARESRMASARLGYAEHRVSTRDADEQTQEGLGSHAKRRS